MNLLYIIHYGYTLKEFYCEPKTNIPKKIIGDGGSNIHIHLIQHLSKKGAKVTLSTFNNNYQYMAFFGKSPNVQLVPFWTPQLLLGRHNFFVDNIYKIFFLPLKLIFIKTDYDFVISTTDFLPDVIYSFLIKVRNPKIKWVASFFLAAPKPWAKNNPYRIDLLRYLTGVLYWLLQSLSYWLIKWKANFVLVTSQPDVNRFITKQRKKEKIIVVQGGVDINEAKKYLGRNKILPIEEREYDACFIGRFHMQKGVLFLIDIWKKVVDKKSKARLAMIGNGPLESEVRKKIEEYGLVNNVDLFGFMDGEKKFEIFKQSKIILHPATFDSGGMAAAEAMAWGLPGISFDLEALRTYYPRGMIKVPLNDLEAFSKEILRLLDNPIHYERVSREARDLVVKEWNWNIRLEYIYDCVMKR